MLSFERAPARFLQSINLLCIIHSRYRTYLYISLYISISFPISKNYRVRALLTPVSKSCVLLQPSAQLSQNSVRRCRPIPAMLSVFFTVLWICIPIRKFFSLLDPDPSIIKQKSKINFNFYVLFYDFFDFLTLKTDVNISSKSTVP